MSAPPPKIKAFLASIKSDYLDREGVAVADLYLAALRVELVQRGVIEDDDSSTLDRVVAVAGKALADDTSIPKPLLAGASVMMARLLETLCTAMTDPQQIQVEDAKQLRAAIQRAKDVGDERLTCLLRLSEASHQGDSLTMVMARIWLIIEGCYYRAAEFQPDTPPMWKKAWDAIVERRSLQNLPSIAWEAAVSIDNLRRIAESKGNAKRVAELQLALAEAALDTSPTNLSSIDQLVLEAFLSTHRPTKPLDDTKAPLVAAQHLQGLSADRLSSNDNLLRLVLELRIALDEEEASLKATTEADYTAAKNRATTKLASKATYQAKARLRYFGSDQAASLQGPAEALRNAMLDPSLSMSQRRPMACQSLLQYIQRATERAQALGLRGDEDAAKQAWSECAAFVGPILDSLLPQLDTAQERESRIDSVLSAASTEERKLIEELALCLPRAEWMHSAHNAGEELVSLSHLCLARDVLAHCVEQAKKDREQRQSAGVIQSAIDPELAASLRVECAYRSVSALCYLVQTESGNDDALIRRASELSAAKSDDMAAFGECAVAEFGLSYFECLCAWSGLHREPWPFCVTSEARILVSKAASCLEKAKSVWGRPIVAEELLLLDLGKADGEGGSSGAGGLRQEAEDIYFRALAQSEKDAGGPALAGLVRSRCCSGLLKLSLLGGIDESKLNILPEEARSMEGLAMWNVQHIQAVESTSESTPLHFWRNGDATNASFRFQLAATRQIVADTLLRQGLDKEARVFLEDGVRAAPADPSVALALGAFRLRMMFFGGEQSEDIRKAAQTQLLKAAKLDSSRASPFALLGYWFEYAKDVKRAVGCYSKAILLDPSHPVAGRGLLRLQAPETLSNVFEGASESSSASTGWAWRAIGWRKAMVDGKDDLAVVALLKAIRSRDIQNPGSESLSYFYADPYSPAIPNNSEFVDTSAELAASYRRLGRYTASLRSYYTAIEASSDAVSNSILCSCAQVEMELGLFDEAAEKLARAVKSDSKIIQSMSAHGFSLCLLSMAKRDAEDGKCGSALDHLERAIESCHRVETKVLCVYKLLGDIHSFGYSLPSAIFVDGQSESSEEEAQRRRQIAFVTAGIEAYRTAETLVASPDPDEAVLLRACLAADIGTNLLSQAQLLASWQSRGIGLPSTEAEQVYGDAEREFRRSLQLCPIYPQAWCGLGCAVAWRDPLLAQHAFCRSIELDNLQADSYANLSFLYTAKGALKPSASVSDALTQVADIPEMWINRALILERQVDQGDFVSQMRQAADAYRAALQVAALPIAKNGFAVTCRNGEDSKFEALNSDCLLTEYLNAAGRADLPSVVLHGVTTMERSTIADREIGAELLECGREQTSTALDKLRGLGNTLLNTESIETVLTGNSKPSDKPEPLTKPLKLDVRRRILVEPNRADLWLELAKDLALAVEVEYDGKDKRQQRDYRRSLEGARMAIRRACALVVNHVQEPKLASNRRSGEERLPSAALASEAWALKHWLEQASENEGPKTESAPVDLQRALILCPGNPMARAAL